MIVGKSSNHSMSVTTRQQVWQFVVTADDNDTAVNYLCRHTGLSKGRLKDAMNKGAVWLQRDRGKRKRLRRVTAPLRSGDRLDVYFDPDLLALSPPVARLLWQTREYSLWYKPAGLLSQGNDYGDHASLLRQAELSGKSGQAYLVHRLDREATGLMLIAHSQDAARRLSTLFQQRQVHKWYEVLVVGQLSPSRGRMNQPLDGKSAITGYEVMHYDSQHATSLLRVQIETGRRHQIRRHLAMAGHPVLGDPRYGKDNKNAEGLQLRAVRLQFTCPYSQVARDFQLDTLLDE